MSTLRRGDLRGETLPDRASMGAAAAAHVAERLRGLLQPPDARARLMFAAAASQVEFLDALAATEGIDWSRVDAFHLDEYVGLPVGHEQSFGAWLDRRIFSRVHPGSFQKLDPTTTDPEAESDRYGLLLLDGGIDLALIGIGENGHLAFNDPHVADFEDPRAVKPVDIDETSRAQQVRDGAFATVDEVPPLAMTVTMSAILASRAISVVVPGANKADAVARTLDGPIETACPASALRRHPDAVLFADEAAMSKAAR
jgi:glucosamine-6-phosphate deaminase